MAATGLRTLRLGRAILRIHQHSELVRDPIVRSDLSTLFRAGQAMDFAARIREYGQELTGDLAVQFARFSGLGPVDLRIWLLPTLEASNVVAYHYRGSELAHLEEYVGVSAPVVEQVVRVLEQLGPTDAERAVLHSVELASWAPLTRRQHLDQIIAEGFTEETAEQAVALSLAAGINRSVGSQRLGDDVIYNPYVWSTEAVDIAAFLRGLPSAERAVLLGICEEATSQPGIALPQLGSANPGMIVSARKVGLLQGATVVSTNFQGKQTYLFSPLLESEASNLRTTDALHERKLFVAHILFGHEKATRQGGRIKDPVVLVDALLRRGVVGPAPNIATDYQLLEAKGIVRVEMSSGGPLMRMVKEDIIADSLGLLERTLGPRERDAQSTTPLASLRPPGVFITPERDRSQIGEDEASMEIMHAAVDRLREEAQRATRHEDPF